MNHRVTWLLASQGFLLAGCLALISGWAKGDLKIASGTLVALISALFGVSAYICLSIGIMLSAAIRHIKHIQCWWYKVDVSAKPEEIEKASQLSELNTPHPYLQGWKARKHTRPFDTEFMPYFFLGGWIILVFIGIVVAWPAFWTKFPNQLTRILAVLAVFGVAVGIALAGYIAVVGYIYGKRSAGTELTK